MLDYLAQLARYGRIDPLEFYVSDAHRTVYVENAKVACTAIKAALYPAEAAAFTDQSRFHEELRSRAAHCLPDHASDYLVFTFVRHPEARLQSCYRDKVQRRAGGNGASILHRRFHRGLFAALGRVDICAEDLPFDRFALAVARIPDRVSDRHFASQARAVEAVERAPNHFIGRMEQLDQDWSHLQSRTGLPALAKANASVDREHAELCSDVARTHIARRYARDFSMLGYGHD